MTKSLADRFAHVTSVDGSKRLLEQAREYVTSPNVTFHHCLFEDFVSEQRFDSIILSRILEHIKMPVELLARIKKLLAPQGKIFIIVPNAHALNRRVGRAMGMLKRLDELHERDIRVGHYRVYSSDTLRADIESAGLCLEYLDGIFLKPLSDRQVQDWEEKLLDAFFEVGHEFPDLCTEIFAECSVRQSE